jgi:two-component system response regulator
MRIRSILLVEDNPNDEELTCDALTGSGLLNAIVVARDGAEALDYLFGLREYAGRDVTDLPMVVLLDLNLPKISGMDVLRAIRSDPRTRLIPVVILTSSSEDVDLLDGYENGINSYIVKPVGYASFTETVQRLGLYWMLNNQQPPPPPLPLP